MEYIRLLHPKHWDAQRERFGDVAFKLSSDSGLSLVCKACAEAASSGLICEHIRKFYPNIASDPAVFLFIKDTELPKDSKIIETLSDTGDTCHREVVEAKEKHLKRAFMAKSWTEAFICDGGTYRPLEKRDWENWGKLA